MQIFENYPLRDFNSFGVEANCRFFVEITSTEELKEILKDPFIKNNKLLPLGGGSNLLFTKDFNGTVLKVSIPGIHVVKEDDQYYWIKAGAGVIWHDLVLSCLQANFWGIENLALIPGTVGAAPIQNIGAYGREISQVLEGVEAYEISSGEKKIFSNKDCKFGYRESIFKKELKAKYIISQVALRLFKEPKIDVRYDGLEHQIKEMSPDEISVKTVAEAVIKIRNSKLPDPKKLGNAGSFFKNPIISSDRFQSLRKKHSNIPGYPIPGGDVKIPAAWLIEKAGWKGKKLGSAGVHKEQALVLVNHGGATGTEILQLAEKVRQTVKSLFGVILVPEVQIL